MIYISLLLITFLFSIYLFADAYQDHLDKIYSNAGHRRNALVRGAAAIGLIILGFHPYFTTEQWGMWVLIIISTALFLLFYGWFVFDIAYNLMAEKPIFKYVGSGKIDQIFLKGHGRDAWKRMLTTKLFLMFLFFSWLIFAINLYNVN